MKLLIFPFTFIIIFSCSRLDHSDILLKTVSKLRSLESIEYEHISQRVYNHGNTSELDTAICFFDFSSKDSLLGSKYYFQSKYGEQVFNGKTEFSYNIKENRILFTDTPARDYLSSSFWIQNSIFSLRVLLPQMINDPSISIIQKKDVIIENRWYYKFTIVSKDRTINAGINLIEKTGSKFEQELIINKENYFPYSYRTIYPNNQGFKLATFKNLDTKAIKPDSVWTYDRYPLGFTRQTYEEFYSGQKIQISAKIGSKAPIWKLPLINGDSISLSSQIGNIVLLEFWFPYCKGCVEAVPDINKIQEKYKKEGLKVYGIETLNTKYEKLSEYVKKYNIEYPTLYNGKSVSEEYEAHVAPTFILLDRKGRFIYISEGFNKKELIKTIEEDL